MAAVTYPATTESGGSAILEVRGNVGPVTDANIASIVGAGNSAHFNASFDLVLGFGPHTQHLHFVKGQTYVLAANVKAALLAASAPMTVI